MVKKDNILITGATGFIGSRLYSHLSKSSNRIWGSSRYPQDDDRILVTGTFNKNTDWQSILAEKDVIIHCAAIAHKKITADNVDDVYAVNCDETVRLMKAAIKAGVKQFIFLSSILVMGNHNEKPFTASDDKYPLDDYAKPKAMAETALQKLAAQSDIALTIIRLPLVYGYQAPGNFASLSKMVKRGWWLPLANTSNARSMIGMNNLLDFVETCLLNEKSYNQVFLVSDNQDVSTTALLQKVAEASGKPAKLFLFPKNFFRYFMYMLGKKNMYLGLWESLQVDISETCNKLGWQPPYTLEQELAQCFESRED